MSNKHRVGTIILSSLAMLAANSAIAAPPGPYFGVSYGWASDKGGIQISDLNNLVTKSILNHNYTMEYFKSNAKSNGAAGRIFAGFLINCNWALEFGWSHFPSLPVHARAHGVDHNSGRAILVDNALGSIKMDAFDLTLKAIWELPGMFSVYAKAGAAYIESRSSEQANVNVGGRIKKPNTDNTQQRYYPTFGVGIGYDLTAHLVADLSYNRIQKVHSKDIGSTNLVSVGLTWYWGPEAI